jgi:unsaturated rhamnogalacturonyl hydrolase
LALVLILSASSLFASQPKEFRHWPAGASPKEVGERVAERFVSTVKLTQDAAVYPAICTWYGALTFAQLAADKFLLNRLIGQFDEQFTPALSSFVLTKQHVDFSVSGAVPLQIYLSTRNSRYLTSGLTLADHQWESPTGRRSEPRNALLDR